MKNGRILFINEEECKKVLPLAKVLELMETVLIEHAEGTATLPVKLHMGLRPDYNGYINSMPSYLKKHDVYGVKLAGCHYDNPKKGLPTSTGTVSLYHPDNGMLYSFMDGTYITAMAAADGMVQYGSTSKMSWVYTLACIVGCICCVPMWKAFGLM